MTTATHCSAATDGGIYRTGYLMSKCRPAVTSYDAVVWLFAHAQ